jgi:Zn-dependent peptidase ImmA (M78 family)/transcriptional regulator with XRE-family HTH domain
VTVRANIEPAVLRWARETAGYAIEDAARRVPVKPERLASWEVEVGEVRPTIGQLRTLANVYKRPLSVFFLPEPPAEPPIEVHDFRQLPGQPPGTFSPAVLLQLRRARERRQLALDLLEDLEHPILPFGVKATLDDDPEQLGARFREILGVDLAAQARWTGIYDAFNAWRSRIEALGVLVFQMSRVEPEEIRGFSLAEERLPVIAVNTKDAPNARVFTMLHELCHVVLRRSGVCEPDEDRLRPSEERRVEVFCNSVAGAALLPMRALLADEVVAINRGSRWPQEALAEIARRFSVSRFVVLRRLLVAGRTTPEFYREKHEEWTADTRQNKRKTEGGPPPDRVAVAERGQTFVRLVLQSYYQDRITLSDVSEYLGVRLKHLSKIERAVGF